MTFVAPATAALYVAVLGLASAGLTANVIRNRVRSDVQAGDGGDARLACAIRAHANFCEQVPLALLLLVLADALGASAVWVNGLGCLLLVARAANAVGLTGSLGPTKPRQLGAALTLAMVVACALLVLWRATQ